MDNCLIAMAKGETALHRQMVHKLLDIFEEKSYILKPSKCKFEKEEVDFLGHGKVTIKPVKLGGITDWPTELHNIKDIRSTLGVLGFQHLFIKNFSTITKPIMDLLKKDTVFLWMDPRQEDQFILEVDALQYATGAILYQADPELKDRKGNPLLQPCRYHAQTFSATEQQYPIYNREYLAIMQGLIHWDYLLRGPRPTPTIIITDHANLQYY
jgi:RNase H-like domain found in reverse transcriptase